MPNLKPWIKTITVLSAAVLLFACSSGNPGSTTALVDSSGNHPANWLENHWLVYDAAPATASCAECHGSDLSGGISKVSCFSAQTPNGQQCHASTLGHPAGWNSAIMHGQAGAMASSGVSSGFAYCSRCHGAGYDGGAGKAVSCFSCHTSAPHPPKPWLGGTLSHTTTSPTNAAACFQCHANGNNFGPVLVSTPLAGSPPAPTPDCFNNTLCHGNVSPPHLAGAAYLQASLHGSDAAGKNPAKPELNLTSCKPCHAGANARFNVPANNMVNGCETCHAAYTAHPTPWLPARTGSAAQIPTPDAPNSTSHATVPITNLTTDCALCHGAALDGIGGNGAPSCMSAAPKFGISCHASSPVAKPTGCTSCHPAFVDRKPLTGAHRIHLGLPNVGCDACHSGGGVDPDTNFGAKLHACGFTQMSSALYWSETGGFRFNADGTCSNARCHGGGDPVTHTTPAWESGAMNVDMDCLSCHEQGNGGNLPQTPQFNSFYSGSYDQVVPAVNLHKFHLQQNNPFTGLRVFCTDCHTMTAQLHFGGLATAVFEAAPGDSVAATRITGGYDKNLGLCSNVSCHRSAAPNAKWFSNF